VQVTELIEIIDSDGVFQVLTTWPCDWRTNYSFI